MPSATYPLMRRKRRRHLSVPVVRVSSRARLIALGVLGVVAVIAALVVLRPHSRSDPRAAYIAAQQAFARGNYSAARNDAIEAIAGDPQSAAAHLMLARTYLHLGDGLSAEAELIRVHDAGVPLARLRGERAQAQLLQGDLGAALAEAAQAPEGDPLAIRMRARALGAQGHADQANMLLAALLDRSPTDAGAMTDLGRIRLSSGDLGGASVAAAQAAKLAPNDPIALTLQGEVVRARYGLTAAIPWFEAALKRDAYYHPALIEYAATLGDAGRYADMLRATRAAEAARPGSAQALYLQATLAARAGKTTLARDLLQKATGLGENLPGAMLLNGGIDYAEGQDEQAIGSWRQLVAMQPMNVMARRLLGAALLRSGDAQGALDLLRPMALRDDADAYTLTLVGRAFEATGDRVSAARFLDRAAAGRPATASAFATDDSAAAFAADAVEAPTDPNYLLGLIRAKIDTGDTAGAVDQARRLANVSPGAPAAQLALGDALVAADRYGEAVTAYARAADLSFDEPTMLRLVDALGHAGKARDAAAALGLYLQQNPQSLAGQRLRAHWLVLNGQGESAIETLEGVRRMIGNRDAALLADLALAYAAAGDGGIAHRYGRAAYALAPMNAAVADAYGVALAADQDVDGARQMLIKAASLAPGNTAIAAHLKQIEA